MLGNVEKEQIRELCRRFCAVNAAEAEVSNGYFRIDGGESVRRARKCAASVPWGDVEATTAEVLRRVGNAVQEHRWVFLRAMPAGESHAADSLRFEGSPEPQIGGDSDSDSPKGQHAAAEALAAVAMGQLRAIEQLVDRCERLHVELQDTTLQRGLYQYHSEALAIGSKSELVTRVVEQLGPQLVAQIPALAAILAAYQAGQEIPAPAAAEAAPGEPGEAIPWHVDRIMSSAAALQVAFGAASEEARRASLPSLGRLRSLVATIAPLVGLRVVDAAEPTPETDGGEQ